MRFYKNNINLLIYIIVGCCIFNITYGKEPRASKVASSLDTVSVVMDEHSIVIPKSNEEDDNLPKIISIGDSTIFFVYRRDSDILEREYKGNKFELDYLNYIIFKNRKKVEANQAHFRLITYVEKKNSTNPTALNKAFIQTSVLRSYLLSQYAIKPQNSTFYIDTIQDIPDRISIEFIHKSIKDKAESKLYYTLSGDSIIHQKIIEKYQNGIPYRRGKRIFTREDYIEFDLKGYADSTRIYEYDKEVKRRRVLDSLRAVSSAPILPVHFKEIDNHQRIVGIERAVNAIPMENVQYHHPKVAIKTDILNWASITPSLDLTRYYLPNISLEYFYCRKWSVNADFILRNKNNKNILYREIYPVEKTKSHTTKQLQFETDKVNAIDTLQTHLGYFYTSIEPRFYPIENDTYKYLYIATNLFYGEYDNFDPISIPTGSTGHFFGLGMRVGCIIPIYYGLVAEISVGGEDTNTQETALIFYMMENHT